MMKTTTCCICGKPFPTNKYHWGNNPEPVMPNFDKEKNTLNWCCDECNLNVVIPARLRDVNTL